MFSASWSKLQLSVHLFCLVFFFIFRRTFPIPAIWELFFFVRARLIPVHDVLFLFVSPLSFLQIQFLFWLAPPPSVFTCFLPPPSPQIGLSSPFFFFFLTRRFSIFFRNCFPLVCPFFLSSFSTVKHLSHALLPYLFFSRFPCKFCSRWLLSVSDTSESFSEAW